MATKKTKVVENSQLTELFFRKLLENLDVVFWEASPGMTKMIYVSPQYETIWGRPCESLYQNPKSWADAIVPKDRQRILDTFIALKEQKNEYIKSQYDIMRPDGTIRTILDQGFQVRDKKGHVVAQMGIASDITELLWTQKNIEIQSNVREVFRKSKELKSSLEIVLSDICRLFKWDLGQLWILDSEKNVLNQVYSWITDEIITGQSIENNGNQAVRCGVDLLGWAWEQNTPIWLINLDEYRNYPYLQKFFKLGLKTVLILPIYFSGNTYGIIELYSKSVFRKEKILLDIYSNLCYWIGSFIYRKKLEENLRNLSRLDFVTGLLNPTEFQKVVEDKLRLQPKLLALAIFDVDQFNEIKSSFGFETGNNILKQVTARLHGFKLSGIEIARLSNGSFALAMLEKDTFETLSHIKKVIELFDSPFFVDNQEIHITISIGVSIYPDHGDTYQKVLKNAYTAVHKVRSLGGNNFQLFSERYGQEFPEHLTLYAAMYHALQEKQFVLYLQPKIDVKTKTIIGAEALIRWKHPIQGIIPPSQFLPYAENSGFILRLDEWVINEACEILNNWSSKKINIPLSINISPKQFGSEQFINTLKKAINRYKNNFDAKRLEIEITEGALLQETNTAIESILALNKMGFNIHIDDFGTGFSSLMYLTRFRIHALKIDKYFIDGLPYNTTYDAIVNGVISLAHELGIKIIAEGVENKKQFDYLFEKNCDEIQGYYFYPPLPIEEFEAILESPKA